MTAKLQFGISSFEKDGKTDLVFQNQNHEKLFNNTKTA